tara:strand:- start:4437 stop:5396 length:960 start_codon:yes stop_codon:yes gene_type:complete
MAVNTTSTLSDQFQKYFSKQLLEKIMPTLRLAPFAKKSPLPGKSGSKEMRWFRFAAPSTANIQEVSTEGTTPGSSEKSLSLETVDAVLTQYLQYITLTDILTATELFNHVEESIREHGEDAALHMDNLIRNELASNETGKNYVYADTDWANSNSTAISASNVLDSVTALKIDSAPTVDGNHYAGVFPCETARDLMRDSDWLEVHKYSAPDGLFEGEVGKLYGCRVLETNQGFRSESTGSQYSYSASGDTYSSFVFGRNAYGVPELNSQSPFSPQVIIADTADKSDPGNLKTVVTYKSFYTAKTLQPKWVAEIYSGTAFS